MSGYELSRDWFDFCFENPEKITPSHTAIYMFAIEHCNRLGWKTKFGFPTQMVMDAIGIKKYQTYSKYFDDLCLWGFFILVQKSTNQYSSNIISLSSGMLKNGKALGKAIVKHASKQLESTGQSTGQSKDSIDKPINQEPLTINLESRKKAFGLSLEEFKDDYPRKMLSAFYEYWTECNVSKSKMRFEREPTWETKKRLVTWAAKEKEFKIGQPVTSAPAKKSIDELRNS